MKIVKKVFIIILVIVAVVVFALHVAVNIKGKEILTKKLGELFKREVTIGKLNTYFFLNVYLEDIDVKGLFHVDKVFIVGGIFDIFSKNFHLALLKVVHPVVTLDKEYVAVALAPLGAKAETTPSQGQATQESAASPDTSQVLPAATPVVAFTINRLIVNDGVFTYADQRPDNKTVTVTLEKVYMKVNNLNFTSRGLKKFSIQLKGNLPWEGTNYGSVDVDGWVDYPRKNMDIDLKLQNVDYRAFSEYYPEFWKPDNLGVQEASLSLNANLHSRYNDLLIDTFLILERITFMEGLGDKSKINYLRTIIALIQGVQSKPILHFKLNTKMDSPKLDFSPLKKNFRGVIQVKPSMVIEEALGKAKEKITQGTTSAKDMTVDNAVDAIKGVVSAIKGAIKKEEAAQVPEQSLSQQEPGADANATSVGNMTGNMSSAGEVNQTVEGNATD
ncbi:MAG: DUF748 domain-containing protein [Candidatus Omnitrophica bacterium]|nr:DUF748 domain-containing protein [Candidatus Omnitrophota bacterium]